MLFDHFDNYVQRHIWSTNIEIRVPRKYGKQWCWQVATMGQNCGYLVQYYCIGIITGDMACQHKINHRFIRVCFSMFKCYTILVSDLHLYITRLVFRWAQYTTFCVVGTTFYWCVHSGILQVCRNDIKIFNMNLVLFLLFIIMGIICWYTFRASEGHRVWVLVKVFE